MSRFLNRDAQQTVTELRDIGLIGFEVVPALAANTWSRLMPHGSAAAISDEEGWFLNIGSLPTDIEAGVGLLGWDVVILNDGNYQIHTVEMMSGAVLGLATKIEGVATGIQYVLRPPLVNAFVFNYSAAADDTVELGYTLTNAYSVTAPIALAALAPGQSLVLPIRQVERLFYRFPTVTMNAENTISWGEHYIV